MKELITALVKAQSEFLAIKKTSSNPFYKSKYADLETCIEATKEALNNNGLAVVQHFNIVDGKTVLTTSLWHESGVCISGHQLLEVKDATDPQKIASASTYARRYGLMAILGLAAEDDDANSTVSKPTIKEPQAKTPTMPEKQAETPKIEGLTISGSIVAIVPKKSTKTGSTYTSYAILKDDETSISIVIYAEPVNFEVGSLVVFKDVKVGDWKGLKTYTAKSVEEDQAIPF